MKIAILGATSHIAKGLIDRFLSRTNDYLYLYARAPEKLNQFLKEADLAITGRVSICDNFEALQSESYDGIINCIGAGTYSCHKGDYTVYFRLAEKFDNLVLNYLCDISPGTLYLSMSSGAIYGKGHSCPVEEESINRVRVNHLSPEDYYGIVRLNAEAKHRAFARLNIVDLRIFSYFSRHIDLSDGYFMSELVRCLASKKEFQTSSIDMVRDYLHPEDLFCMVISCLKVKTINDVFDMRSRHPVGKMEILEYFYKTYGLKYLVDDTFKLVTATGVKPVYCSNYQKSIKVGHLPKFSSMDTIRDESACILGRYNGS
jgi:nucleoside-diphosphate-sugar epimerase